MVEFNDRYLMISLNGLNNRITIKVKLNIKWLVNY